jgi:LysR family transcriptional regulator (chromosome initiation inhibitor)
MFDRAQLHALAAVLRAGSFEGAARALSLTQSAVSQRIRALEERAGAVLVIRGHPCRATAAGTRLARHAEEVALLERAAAAEIGAPAGPATVRIAVNADSLATWVLPALASVEGLLFDLVIDDQDHSEALLRDGEVTAAITSRAVPVQGCDAMPLGRLRFVATASPAFAARWFSQGPTAEALSRAPALMFNEKDRLQADWAAAAAGRPVPIPVHRLASSHGFVMAARLGLGWCMIPEPLARADLAAGALVALDARRTLDVSLHWQVTRIAKGALEPLTRAVRQAARNVLLRPESAALTKA